MNRFHQQILFQKSPEIDIGKLMFFHFLKIAFRNLRKYKNQTLISVIGLGVGFTCFALATLWIRYEMTFDSFHRNAKNLYIVYRSVSFSLSGLSDLSHNRNTSYPMSSYLKATFPEIVNAIPLRPTLPGMIVVADDVETPASIIRTDTSFFRIVDMKVLAGSRDFLIPGNNKFAITRKKAQQLFGNENPIGKTITVRHLGEFEICAVVSDMSKRSNFAFDFIQPFSERIASSQNLNDATVMTMIELLPGIDVNAFEKKLYEHHINVRDGQISGLIIKPLTKLRYIDPIIIGEVKFKHIVVFVVSGILVILCSLFNYLTLFLSRFRIRQKELALRVVCGASGSSLLAMLSVEFILTFTFAVALGCMLTQLLHKPFLALSDIQMSLPAIYLESLVYIGGIILVSLLFLGLILFIFRCRSLNVSIRRTNKNMSRKISVVVQLIISIGFAFCAVIIFKQMYFLHHAGELGFSLKSRGSVSIEEPLGTENVLANKLRQIPEIIEVVDAGSTMDLISPSGQSTYTASAWDDKPIAAENINIQKIDITREFIDFYHLQLSTGEMLTDFDPDSLVMLNESAVKLFGWHDPIGKRIDGITVKGVLKDIHNRAPTIEARPMLFKKGSNLPRRVVYPDGQIYFVRVVLFKYHEGMWESCREKIAQLIPPEFVEHGIKNSEEAFNEFLKSENALLKLLSFVSTICILICIFGFVSFVSLTCEARRKEIAIRKISGATSGDILAIFAKEYFLLLFIGAAIAFTAGYYIMQRWLEHYVIRTDIPAWIYLSIVFVLALVIVLCVGWQIWRASTENPAEVIKFEN